MDTGIFENKDCMDGMAIYPDKYFDLAIVDPPYGAGGADWGSESSRFGGLFDKYKKEKSGKKVIDWDVAPDKEYFEELFRVSKNQIIWGGNYFNEVLPSNRNFIIWRKLTISERFSMAMAEYAWTSIQGNAKVFECTPQGSAKEERFHPTQKPVKLYAWLLRMYAKPGDKILDTHVGSASSLIACHRAGMDYVGFEINEEYYRLARARIEEEIRQVQFEL